ncbi:inner nuclear membrane protein enriched at telomere/subtelomere region, partial [Coemansia sp. RSA 1591]
MENDDYLKDGFDAQTLNMSAIRSLLVKHSVAYPANAKKPQLVTLLHDSVLSKASKLRKEAKRQRRAKADGRDIEQVGTSKTDRSAKQEKTDERSAKQAGTAKAIGSRTRSQTPRTERTRAPQFTVQTKDQDTSEKPSQDEKKTQKNKKPSRDVKKAQNDEDKEAKRTKKPKTKKVERPVGSPPRAVGKASDVKRTGNKRKLSDNEQDVSADSGDDRVFTPHRVRAKQPVRPREPETGNFSDENPFQSSPEAARKRRRKAEVKPTTPMSALRKSQPSGVSFRVALPSDSSRQNSIDEDEVMMEPPKPLFEVTEDEEMEESPKEEKPRAKVSELVARYQQAPAQVDRPRSPTVRIRDGLHAEAPKPVVEPVAEPVVEAVVRPAEPAPPVNPVIRPEPTIPEIRSEQIKPVIRPELIKPDQPKRFTMTPDALREIAAGQNDPQRRRTPAPSGLPP